jgi:hypothetical protein
MRESSEALPSAPEAGDTTAASTVDEQVDEAARTASVAATHSDQSVQVAIAPADPVRVGRRPRRVREEAPVLRALPAHARAQRPTVSAPRDLQPPANTAGVRTGEKLQPICGFPYGPRNTCPVDTFLTVLQHALTKEEHRELKRHAEAHASTAEGALHVITIRRLRSALKRQRANDDALQRTAKRRWYEHLCGTPSSRATDIECRCRCRCANCESGSCVRCASCDCNVAHRMGHTFGVAELFFLQLAPAAVG